MPSRQMEDGRKLLVEVKEVKTKTKKQTHYKICPNCLNIVYVQADKYLDHCIKVKDQSIYIHTFKQNKEVITSGCEKELD